MAKSKKNRSTKMVFFLIMLPILAFGLAGLAISKGIKNYLWTSRYFDVRTLVSEGLGEGASLEWVRAQVIGKNIFSVDLVSLAQSLKRKNPHFYSMRVGRQLPSALLIEAKERIPVAILKRDRIYVFDAEGVALSSLSEEGLVDLPLIIGFENKLSKIKTGIFYSPSGFKQALGLARVLGTELRLVNQAIGAGGTLGDIRIDATDPKSLSFSLKDNLRVVVGDKEFKKRLVHLPAILRSLGSDFNKVSYIDLRLREPVISMKKSVQ